MHHLAQLNVARMRYALDDPRFSDFVGALDPVNAAAEASPGFVWRLQTDEGNATAVRIHDDPTLIVNLSVWASLDDLKAFVRSASHLGVMRRRAEWFAPMDEAYLVLWWVPAGRVPDIAEAQMRLDRLRRDGPTAEAFDFGSDFPPPAD